MKMSNILRVIAVITFLNLILPSLNAQKILDKDGDGIPDVWETAGFTTITLPDGTKQKLDLTKDGPLSPDHKDVFVWVAWMESPTHSHKASQIAMRIVKDAFAKAPVDNLDGKSGIRLHIYFSPKSVPEIAVLGTTDANGNYNWAAFNSIKKQTFPVELEHVFHFCLFAHDIDSEHHSGLSKDIGAYDFIVSLGAFGLQEVGDTQSQAGTFMHELGHNLGLRHGGSDDVNFKPNYVSVMNYFFQLDGLPINGEPGNFDYSRFAIDADENTLGREHGLNVQVALAIYGSQYYCANQSNSMTIDSIGAPVDWDCSGALTGTVKADINGDRLFSALKGFDDWQAIRFTFPIATAGATPKARLKLADELPLSIANKVSIPPVAHVQAAGLSGGVKVWWKNFALDRVVAYKVFRKSSDGQQVEIATVDKNIFIDTPPGKGTYSYFVTGVYVPFGNARAPKPPDFVEVWKNSIIDASGAIADIAREAPYRMQNIQTEGVKGRAQGRAALPQYLLQTTPSVPASITVE
jgi:hypothetical protein